LSCNATDCRVQSVIDIVKRYDDLGNWFDEMQALSDAKWCRDMRAMITSPVTLNRASGRKRASQTVDNNSSDVDDERTQRAVRRRRQK
jgi:hypothetical protein